uniref:Uncharacterized protein n=1 Tax=Arundo donax TaxID=35708 RepID=A0A0A9F6P1_ARUDO
MIVLQATGYWSVLNLHDENVQLICLSCDLNQEARQRNFGGVGDIDMQETSCCSENTGSAGSFGTRCLRIHGK